MLSTTSPSAVQMSSLPPKRWSSHDKGIPSDPTKLQFQNSLTSSPQYRISRVAQKVSSAAAAAAAVVAKADSAPA